ncbi:MAG TPA: HEAT repeat domain-containing protein [Thermoguttaceae bacterium]|nr:HEAT repeat domain-containing protein [Thermoguttaceae bacterium]
MKYSKIIGFAIMGLAIAAMSTQAQEETSLEQTLDELLPKMGAEKIPDRRSAQQQWQEICFEAGEPGNEDRRAEVCTLMAKKLGTETALPARLELLTQLERIGRAECVEAVAVLLSDSEARVAEAASRALANNPAPEATAKLVAKLQGDSDAALKTALLNSLGYRGDSAGVGAAAKELAASDPAIAAAAARALGKIGGGDAAKALSAARPQAKGDLRLRISDACLLCADGMLNEGKKKEAMAIYAALNKPEESKAIRMAAMQGLLKAAGKR